MSKVSKILLSVIGVLVVVFLVLAVWQIFFAKASYYAVYTRTGDIYFGKLAKFPSFGLKNVYTLQVNTQDQQNPIRVQKFSDVFWGPEDYLKMNRDQVVWYTKLKSDGQLAQLLAANPNLIPQQPAPQIPPQQQVPPAQQQTP